MRVRLDDGDRLVLSGPPGGRGSVILLFIVGAAMAAGGGLFLRIGLTSQQPGTAVLGALVGAVGCAMLLGGIGVALTRDRLEMDRVTGRGGWTRRLCGRLITPAVEFDLEHARHVMVDSFTETSPRTDGGGTSSVERVRACLLITKPRRRIVLDEAERQRVARVQGVARSAASFLGLEVEELTTTNPRS